MNKDNQLLSSHLDKGWMAGIIDGEGCLQLAHQKYHKDKVHFRPQISICNTNPEIIKNVCRIAKDNGLPLYILNFKPFSDPKRKRFLWKVQIMGLKRCKQWIEYISDSLMGKKVQAQILKDFINYRLSLPHGSPITQTDFDYKESISKANQAFKGELINDYTLDLSNNDMKI